MGAFDIASLHDRVQKRLSEKRFMHTLGVVRCVKILAERILPDQVDEISAAAYLHDIAKEIPKEELLRLIEESPYSISREELACDALLHSFAGPILIRRDFSEYATKDILSSVYFHTTGTADMSVFDRIVFVADYIEEGRTYPDCIAVRELLFDMLHRGENPIRSLMIASLAVLDRTLIFLLNKNKYVSEQTLRARNSTLGELSLL